MNDFKTIQYVRDTRDKMYEETKGKSPDEIRDYYREKASWLKVSLKKNKSKIQKI
jgi:DNA phosphorothioation-dependent restriction protein DptG